MKTARIALAFLIFSVVLSPIGIRAQQGTNNAVPHNSDCTVQKIAIRINYAPGCWITLYALIPSCQPHK